MLAVAVLGHSSSAPISVIIPARNAEQFIAAAIKSVQAQSLLPAEIIVVANDSSDRTSEIARDLGVRVVTESKKGLSIARNAGIRAAGQPWIAFLDADDWWTPDKIERQWRLAEEFPAAALISCDNYFVRDDAVSKIPDSVLTNRWKDMSAPPVRGRHGIFIANPPGDIMKRFCPKSPTALFQREVLSCVGPFNEDLPYNDELEFFMRVMARFPLAMVELPLVYVRLHEGNRSRDVEGKQAALVQMIELMLKEPERYPPKAGELQRRELKEQFHNVERSIRDRRRKRSQM